MDRHQCLEIGGGPGRQTQIGESHLPRGREYENALGVEASVCDLAPMQFGQDSAKLNANSEKEGETRSPAAAQGVERRPAAIFEHKTAAPIHPKHLVRTQDTRNGEVLQDLELPLEQLDVGVVWRLPVRDLQEDRPFVLQAPAALESVPVITRELLDELVTRNRQENPPWTSPAG